MDYKTLRIYELRDYARKIGVKSPTSKRKEQLFEEIELVLSGDVVAYSTNKGRPNKSTFAYVEDLQTKKELNIYKVAINDFITFLSMTNNLSKSYLLDVFAKSLNANEETSSR